MKDKGVGGCALHLVVLVVGMLDEGLQLFREKVNRCHERSARREPVDIDVI